jgi:diacylglycerol kinase family enzyme
MRALLVWNPVSTGVDARSVGTASVSAARHLELVSRHTREAGDAGRLALEAADDGYDAVFVLGGDGTANEVLNAVGARIPIGALPGGGTSVLPRALGLPDELEACVEALCRALDAGSVREVNVGTLNGRRFAFAAGIGLDAEIVQRVDERGRGGEGVDAKRPGDVWFVKAMIDGVLSGEYAEPRLRIDAGDESFEAMTAFVANTDPWSFAGPVPLHLAPDAAFEEGLELVAVVEPIEPSSGVARLASLLKREADDAVRRLSVERASVVCRSPTPTQVDGELLGELTRVELGLERRGARFLVPAPETP